MEYWSDGVLGTSLQYSITPTLHSGGLESAAVSLDERAALLGNVFPGELAGVKQPHEDGGGLAVAQLIRQRILQQRGVRRVILPRRYVLELGSLRVLGRLE